jgi:hypothetical protein
MRNSTYIGPAKCFGPGGPPKPEPKPEPEPKPRSKAKVKAKAKAIFEKALEYLTSFRESKIFSG